jgi:hypothetical protein
MIFPPESQQPTRKLAASCIASTEYTVGSMTFDLAASKARLDIARISDHADGDLS